MRKIIIIFILTIMSLVCISVENNAIEIINDKFRKDKNNVYYKEKILEGISPIDFEILTESNISEIKYSFRTVYSVYVRDYKGVYFISIVRSLPPVIDTKLRIYIDKLKEVKEIKEFAVLKGYNSRYGMYKGKIFFQDKEIKGIDKNTFEILNFKYSKDKNNVYCGSSIMEGVDTKTFKVISEEEDLTKDKNRKYQFCKKIDEFIPSFFYKY